ncbi:hypothetical protein B0T16DRAFT_511475 [Cercophora newfieldiana]|uniref:Secreted protein n=1 Tax=Cercophora newfieldiana TaxID=92897 RepID=A0AA39Y8M8_9PEZI|nr:hypothetical protein B0T16DRAFT_511475 [Cercophora newfieldiana]
MHPSYTFPFFATVTAVLAHQEPFVLHRDAAHHPDLPQDVQVSDIVLSGSGCPPSYAPGQKLSDPTILILPSTSFTAESGRGQATIDGRTNCQILARLRYPSGWQFSVTKAEYAGYARLPEGITGTSKTTYFFSSSDGAEVSSSKTLDGPYDDTYSRSDTFEDSNTVWSSCGPEALLNVNSEVRLAPLGSNLKAVIGVNTPENVGITWRKCG